MNENDGIGENLSLNFKLEWQRYLHKGFSIQYIHSQMRTVAGEKIYIRTSTFGNVKKSLGITGYPDGIDIRLVDGKIVKRFNDLALHELDLDSCIKILETVSQEKLALDHPLAEAAILAGIAKFIKCFGVSAARGQLNAKKIYKDIPKAIEVFEYFKALRDKHVIHDENPMTMIASGIVINRPGADRKIADVIALPMVARVASKEQFEQLWNLAYIAREWVGTQITELANLIIEKYEAYSHQELMNLPPVKLYKHGTEVVGKNRNEL
jgi:hypothetical protein